MIEILTRLQLFYYYTNFMDASKKSDYTDIIRFIPQMVIYIELKIDKDLIVYATKYYLSG